MADIYQEIWDADQNHAGIKAVDVDAAVDEATSAHGYVRVNEKPDPDEERRILNDLQIPAGKLSSYQLVEKLFNNFTLDQTKRETNTPDERQEVQAFLSAIHKSPPMEVARAYVADKLNRAIGYDEWWSMIETTWFEQFSMGNNKDLSGFEHVIVGEQQGGKVQGYHFWYKYYLDERFQLNDEELDLINVISFEGTDEDLTPDVVTLKYKLKAFDYEAKTFRPLTKPKGGFWVGPSAEGIMAIGLVRFLRGVGAPGRAVINGAEYKLNVFAGSSERNLRTFYPEFLRMV